ncbi:glycoside hydrolase superfamily [Tribonema minus]|uniref:Glycoside hydrolase superfamily n=1 Tax=Tribonema minus TaxID=303371 RepID=A0A835Z646_9STRA|nr:glycoside hydrolase superfamily [Tribonema minus]
MDALVTEAVERITKGEFTLRQLHRAITKELATVPLFDYVVYNASYGGFNYSDEFLAFSATQKIACRKQKMYDFGKLMAQKNAAAYATFIKSKDQGPHPSHRCHYDVYDDMSDDVKYGLHCASGVFCTLSMAKASALKWNYIEGYLKKGYDVHLVIEFLSKTPLDDINNGHYDGVLQSFAKAANRYTGGKQVYIRPLHELNGNWYAWTVFYKAPDGSNIPVYLDAYRRVVRVIRQSAPGKFLFQQHYNAVNYGADKYFPLKQMYAGDDYVDMVTVSVYNACGTSSVVLRSFVQVFNTFYYQMTAITSRPIGIGELSTTSYCGVDKPAWVREAWHQLAIKYTKVTAVDFFLENKPFGKTLKNWDLNTPADVSAFSSGWAEFRHGTCASETHASEA